MRTRWIASLWLTCLTACGESRAEAPLVVFAAASTTEVVEEVARGFATSEVRLGFGASSTLARQIADGAPADLFLTAHRAWLDDLIARDLVAGEPRLVCENLVVAVAPADSVLTASPPANPAELAQRLAPTDRIAIGSEGVPVGEYARAALRGAGVDAAFAPHEVGFPDARAVARAAELGQVAAAFVYESDASTGELVRLFALEAPVRYWAVLTKGGARPDAAAEFLALLTGPEGRALFERAGFRAADL